MLWISDYAKVNTSKLYLQFIITSLFICPVSVAKLRFCSVVGIYNLVGKKAIYTQ